ncbi:MAG: transposase [bacterium]
MPRSARIVLPGLPHHVTQRGNRRQSVFFNDQDFRLNLKLLQSFTQRNKTTILGWCLMPNHVHLVLIPREEDGLRATVAPLHRTYAEEINRREGWSGHLWQERFSSVPLDESHTLAALRYVDLNPLRTGLVTSPQAYPWSSARAHLENRTDGLVDADAIAALDVDWRGLLASALTDEELERFRLHEKNCLPLGSDLFIDLHESQLGRTLRPQRPGPKRVE